MNGNKIVWCYFMLKKCAAFQDLTVLYLVVTLIKYCS